MAASGPRNLITDVAGILVGQAERREEFTGTTVVLAEQPAVASVDVRGGAPGSRETELLRPETLVDCVDAVVLSGGSAFGLEAAAGVMTWLADAGRGFTVGSTIRSPALRVPIVPAAILFDLNFPGRRLWTGEPPYRALGHAAVSTAAKAFALGNAGAGLGATAGRLKGGLGSASLRLAGGASSDYRPGSAGTGQPFQARARNRERQQSNRQPPFRRGDPEQPKSHAGTGAAKAIRRGVARCVATGAERIVIAAGR